jgi:hypothetical protein
MRNQERRALELCDPPEAPLPMDAGEAWAVADKAIRSAEAALARRRGLFLD